MPAPKLDLKPQWNEDYSALYQLIDDDDELPVDLTGCTVAMEVRTAAGVGGAAVLTATCALADAVNGLWTETITDAAIKTAALAAGSSQAVITFAYDVILTDTAGLRKCLRRGAFIVEPGVIA